MRDHGACLEGQKGYLGITVHTGRKLTEKDDGMVTSQWRMALCWGGTHRLPGVRTLGKPPSTGEIRRNEVGADAECTVIICPAWILAALSGDLSSQGMGVEGFRRPLPSLGGSVIDASSHGNGCRTAEV